MKAHEDFLHFDELESELLQLELALKSTNFDLLRKVLKKLVPGYRAGVE